MTDYTRQTRLFTQFDALVAAVGAMVDVDDGGLEVHNTAVESVMSDSRQAWLGDLSAATPGEKVHGAVFAVSAAEAGVNAVLADVQGRDILRRDLGGCSVPVPIVDDPRAAVGKAAALILSEPAADLDSYVVTGTNGKTTMAYMVESIFGALGRKPGLIGTIEIRLTGVSAPVHLTMPMSDEFQSYLASHCRGGGTDAVIETSSHAFVRGHSDPVRFMVVGPTNLTQGHLDFHGTMGRYYQAKASLFTPERVRNTVISADDEYDCRLLAECVPRLEGEVTALAADSGLPDPPDGVVGWKALAMEGSSFALESTNGRRPATSISFPKGFNVANAMLVAVMVVTAGYSLDELARALPAGINPAVPGCMEILNACPRVIVDFAHSTEAPVNVMKALCPLTEGRLVVLTGSAEDRDKGKYPAMGAAVARYDDFAYTTDDDSHNEDFAIIRAAVIEGTRGFDTPVVEIVDRSQAIDAVITEASEWDAILLAGRGHGTVQEMAGAPIELDDRVETRRALRKRVCVHDGEEKA